MRSGEKPGTVSARPFHSKPARASVVAGITHDDRARSDKGSESPPPAPPFGRCPSVRLSNTIKGDPMEGVSNEQSDRGSGDVPGWVHRRTNPDDKDVRVAGGANIIQQAIEAGLVDEMQIHLAPILLGDGVRLFDHLGKEHVELENTRVIESPTVTHLMYRVVKEV